MSAARIVSSGTRRKRRNNKSIIRSIYNRFLRFTSPHRALGRHLSLQALGWANRLLDYCISTTPRHNSPRTKSKIKTKTPVLHAFGLNFTRISAHSLTQGPFLTALRRRSTPHTSLSLIHEINHHHTTELGAPRP